MRVDRISFFFGGGDDGLGDEIGEVGGVHGLLGGVCYVKDLQQRLLMGAAVAGWLVVFCALPSTGARGLTLRGRPAFFEGVTHAVG